MRAVCDFCYDPDPAILYTLDRGGDKVLVQLDAETYRDGDDQYLACEPCAAIIDAHDLDGLVLRVMLNPTTKSQTPREAARTAGIMRLLMHETFFRYPIKSRQPWSPAAERTH